MQKLLNWLGFYKLGILASLLFLVVGILTLSHYGLNIDEPIHFIRGQAYLHFLLTGETEYRAENLEGPRVSDWKIQQYNGSYFIDNDSGHPPLNGILAAASNVFFYENLGWLGDLESYHLFEVLVSSSLVFLIYFITRKRYGVFAGVIAVLSLALYPLFLGESHFNIKDPVEASFFAFTIVFFYLGVEKKQGWFFFVSSLFCALAFATKFNIVFLPFILVPYLFVRYFRDFRRHGIASFKKIPFGVYVSLVFYPIVVFGIHFLTRPYLWSDPIYNFWEIVQYYKNIGTSGFAHPDYLVYGWNLYPPFFITISTPLWILFLAIMGFVSSVFKISKEKDNFLLLLLLWFAVPIFRVMWPGSAIYSGVRQIMEYVPALAILSGIGGLYLRNMLWRLVRVKYPVSLFVLIGFVPIVIKMVQIHPNENVYVNSLVGGLKGAVEKRIPGAAETMGNVYLQGIWWLNENVEEGAMFKPVVGLASNIPRQFVRADLRLGPYSSGIGREGEYMMEMTSIDPSAYNYILRYLDTFLNPVHEVKADGVTLLKVWKNDDEHTRENYFDEKVEEDIRVVGGSDDGFIKVVLREPAFITRLELEYNNKNCETERDGVITYSLDDESMQYASDPLFNGQGSYAASIQTDTFFVYLFPAYPAKFIQLIPSDPLSCLLQYQNITVKSLRDIKP